MLEAGACAALGLHKEGALSKGKNSSRPGLRQSTSGASRPFLRNVFQNYFHLLFRWKCDTQLCAREALALSKDLCRLLFLKCLQYLVLCMSQEGVFN